MAVELSDEQKLMLQELGTRADRLSPEQQGILRELQFRFGEGPIPTIGRPPETASPEAQAGAQAATGGPLDSLLGLLSSFGTGANERISTLLGLPSDAIFDGINLGLEALGLDPVEPVLGSQDIQALMPTPFEPRNFPERVAREAGKEAVTTLGVTGVTLRVAGGAAAAVPRQEIVKSAKDIPNMVLQELAKVPVDKLVAVEQSLAVSAAAGRQTLAEVFPEAGPLAPTRDLIGEMIGALGPATTLSLLRSASGSTARFAGRQLGLETTEQAVARTGRKLDVDLQEGRLEAGLERVQKIQEDIPEFEPTLGQATGDESALAIERALQRKDPGMFQSVRDRNNQAVRDYFEAQAPEGNVSETVAKLQEKRRKNLALLDVGLARTEAKLAHLRGEVDDRTANILQDAERRMEAADANAAQRLDTIGPKLTPQQRGVVIEQAYNHELAKFREEASINFDRVEELSPGTEISVTNTKEALRRIDEQTPPNVKLIDAVDDRTRDTINNLGRDFELMMRAQKGQADLQIRDASGPGVRIFQEQQGAGGTPAVTGLSRGTPEWFRSLTIGKKALKRKQVENALNKFANGGLPETPAEEEIAKALRTDAEFRNSPFYHPVMDVLSPGKELSISFKELRQFRGQLKQRLRQERAANRSGERDVQVKALNDLLDGVDADLNRLAGDGDIGTVYGPEVMNAYNEAVRHYRVGAERLKHGLAGRVRELNVTQRPTIKAENVAKAFLQDQTSLDDFQAAMGGRDEARFALQDQLREDFMLNMVDPKGRVKTGRAFDKWMEKRAHAFEAFPNLRKEFMLASLREDLATNTRRQAEPILKNPQRAARLEDPALFDRLTAAERQAATVQKVTRRTRKEWEIHLASQFLGADADKVAARIVTSKTPVSQYETVVKELGRDQEAIRGFNRALYDALLEKGSARFAGATGDPPLQFAALHDVMQNNRELLKRILPEHSRRNLDKAMEALEMLSRERVPIGSTGSPTALNLEVTSMLAQWLSRSFAVASGRTGIKFAFSERAIDFFRKNKIPTTEAQRRVLLEEAIFNPKAAMTMILSARGANTRLIRKRIHAHLVDANVLSDLEEQRLRPRND